MKAHEVTTVYKLKGLDKMFIGKYMVIAKTSSRANSLIPLRESESIVHVEELEHIVIIEEDEHERA